MIGSNFKKFAEENGLKVSNGVAYGDFRGYAVTLSEGSGWKMIVISTKFPEFAQKGEMQAEFNGIDLQKQYRVNKLEFLDDGIVIGFTDNPGTMGKLKEFVDFFFPLLDKHGATGVNVCPECGMELDYDGKWKLVNGVAMHLHDGCAAKLQHEADTEEAVKQENEGSYGKGTIGALLGAIIGAIPWAIVQYFGYITAIIGLLIGWLAKKGYDLFHGKNGKGKIVILIISAIIGVIIGNFGSDVIYLIGAVRDGSIAGMGYGDIPAFIAYVFSTDSEYAASVVKNVILGIVFAMLGMIDIFRKTRQETASFKMLDLE